MSYNTALRCNRHRHRCRGWGKGDIYICVIYTPNLHSWITVFVWEREHGRFEGSNKGAKGCIQGKEGVARLPFY